LTVAGIWNWNGGTNKVNAPIDPFDPAEAIVEILPGASLVQLQATTNEIRRPVSVQGSMQFPVAATLNLYNAQVNILAGGSLSVTSTTTAFLFCSQAPCLLSVAGSVTLGPSATIQITMIIASTAGAWTVQTGSDLEFTVEMQTGSIISGSGAIRATQDPLQIRDGVDIQSYAGTMTISSASAMLDVTTALNFTWPLGATLVLTSNGVFNPPQDSSAQFYGNLTVANSQTGQIKYVVNHLLNAIIACHCILL
jgi:hypothetical protein